MQAQRGQCRVLVLATHMHCAQACGLGRQYLANQRHRPDMDDVAHPGVHRALRLQDSLQMSCALLR